MDPTVQYILSAVAVAGILAMAGAMFSIKTELAGLKAEMKLFIKGAEKRFEDHEGRLRELEKQ